MPNQPDSAAELWNLIRDEGPTAIVARFRKPPLPSRLLRDLYENIATTEAFRFIATYPLSPSDLLESLNEHCNDSITLAQLALNPRTPNHLLSRLVDNPDPTVRTTAAKNTQITPRDMRLLSRDIDRSVRAAMAGNALLKPQFQAELALDGNDAVRAALATNPSLIPEIRIALSTDPSPIVRAQLVASCEDEEILLFWADSDQEDLQYALLAHKSLSETVLQSLRHSTHAHIRTLARQSTASLSEHELFTLARQGSDHEKEMLCAKEDLSIPLQRIFSTDPNPSIRSTLAAHPRIHPDFITHFIATTDEAPLLALAENSHIPLLFLLPIAQSGIEGIAERMAYRTSIPEDVFEYLLRNTPEPFLAHLAYNRDNTFPPSKTLNTFVNHQLPSVRALVAHHAELSSLEWQQLLNDPADCVRHALCLNSQTTDLQLEDLFDDNNSNISEAARNRWQSNLRRRQLKSTQTSQRQSEEKTTSIESPNESGVLQKLKTIFK